MFMTNFEFILVFLVIGSGCIWLADKYFFANRRLNNTAEKNIKPPLLVDYAKSFFPVLLIVLLIRSFIGQLYTVPTGSLEPTVNIGDYLIVNQFSYGLRLPLWHWQIIKTGTPKVGDIALFHFPVNPKADLIKRVIGVPGDKISYINKVLYVNGVEAKQQLIGKTTFGDPGLQPWSVNIMQEDLMEKKHLIYLCADSCPGEQDYNFYNLTVPQHMYFMMGDNRDDSDDSRDWGFVPEKDLIGKAEFVVFSWNSNANWLHKIRWSRIGKGLNS